jgi:hypothetical protein
MTRHMKSNKCFSDGLSGVYKMHWIKYYMKKIMKNLITIFKNY